MIVVGLTGSIGMGKSTTADMFRAQGIPVHDSDRTVHELYSGEAVAPIEEAFPGVTVDGIVDRTRLGARVLGNPQELKKLESIVHPLVRAREAEFLSSQSSGGAGIVVVDIPLLLETRDPASFDLIVVVSASPDVQKVRVMARPGMTEEKFAAILAKQMPDSKKRARAHAVIDPGSGFESATNQVRALLQSLSAVSEASERPDA